MSASPRLEQDLPLLLAQLADGTRPDYRDSIVEAVGRTRQRPAWAFPGRWLPMDITAQRVAPRTALRVPIAMIVVIALIAAALVAIAVASRPNIPAPFGPARNGEVVFGAGGDLYRIDEALHSHVFLVDTETDDSSPAFSLDGQHVAFGRKVEDADALFIANADGTDVHALTEPLVGFSSFAWSPDGRTIAAAHTVDGYPQITLLTIDGTSRRTLDLRVPAEDPVWRPPDGRQLLVREQIDGVRELVLVDVATGETHQLPTTHVDGGASVFDGQRASWSPDGTQLVWEQGQAQTATLGNQTIRLHVAGVTPTGEFTSDRRLELDARDDYEYLGRWLTTGDRLAFATQRGCTWQVWIAPGADTSRAVPVGEPFEDCTNEGITFELSPDASRVFTVRNTADTLDPIWVSNTDGSDREALPIKASEDLSWQRLAP